MTTSAVRRRWELGLAGGAAAVAVVGVALTVFLGYEPAVAGLAGIGTAASVGLAPALAAGALGVLLTGRRVLTARGAAIVVGLAVAACIAALIAALAWAAGFDAADAGLDAARYTRVTLTSAVAAWLLGAAAIASLMVAVLPAPRGGAPRWALAVLIGVVAAPLVGAALVAPATMVLVTLALLVVALRTPTPGASAPVESRAAALSARTAVRPALVRLPGWITAAAGTVAIAVALTGSSWGMETLDATQAMQLGIAIGDLCALPLVLSVDLVLAARSRRTTLVHLSAALSAFALLVASAASLTGLLGASTAQWNLLLLAVAVAAVPVAATVYSVFSGTRAVRAVLAVVAAAAFAVTFGTGVLAAAAFLAPPLAAAWAVWGVRALARAPGTPAPAAS